MEDKLILTVGDLRELIRCCEDEEPITFKIDDPLTPSLAYLKCVDASSTAGGRATILWFKHKE